MKNDSRTRIIVDTNLWISFLIGKKLSCLLDFLSDEKVELVVSQELLDEILIVASRPKFKKYFSKEHLDMLWDFMTQETSFYKIDNIPARCRDPKDDYLLELALISEANYLITGDKDLLSMGEIGSCQIITVMEFDVLASSSGCSSFVHEDFESHYNIVIGE
ncbi:putative toxin-antitoxin system toxin component, PIN family [Bacteroides fluxus]|uniref:Toxin-antitoxin system toxin component, PIN family n=1 Tax=Bacteroides fluxus YIT 12057 TaxID=763034 RepID=F3PU71_9BACE|nr:putative toxin-antitoxin system toxin component, PIN family [Bacteroides fluxus]EGF56364.1 toxin-antitoxin system toxin component, PIN family [Bacteroides fluxus YIT 12057]